MLNDLEMEYIANNKRLFSIQNVELKNPNTVILESYLQDRKKYYVNTDNFTLHKDYPTTKENEVTLLCEHLWILKSLKNFIVAEESKVDTYKELLSNILSKQKVTQ